MDDPNQNPKHKILCFWPVIRSSGDDGGGGFVFVREREKVTG